MTDTPDQYGVAGHPVAHSWSPFIHGIFAKETGQSMVYRLYDFTPEEFRDRVVEFFQAGGRGLNVTLPHKVAAVELANELTPRAARAQAVNTLALQGDGRLLGDNTDGAGLVRDLCDNFNVVITRRRILIIGSGGATRGVIAPLMALEPLELVIANRTAEKARTLAGDFQDLGPVTGVGFAYIPAGGFDVIINATSASLSGDVPDIPVSVIGEDTVCYDMAYGKADTAFIQWAVQHGCSHALQGWGMLVEQAAESFRVWRGVRPPTGPVLTALKERAARA
ncbi:MAG TPA: shikimate dehydrogenase [Steroidobacteraceae bacterium]|jgi:shikimate dehydrogenase